MALRAVSHVVGLRFTKQSFARTDSTARAALRADLEF
jgi:hypothetical protein